MEIIVKIVAVLFFIKMLYVYRECSGKADNERKDEYEKFNKELEEMEAKGNSQECATMESASAIMGKAVAVPLIIVNFISLVWYLFLYREIDLIFRENQIGIPAQICFAVITIIAIATKLYSTKVDYESVKRDFADGIMKEDSFAVKKSPIMDDTRLKKVIIVNEIALAIYYAAIIGIYVWCCAL